ncbi:hypothetical protein F1188_13125 [Roseospira marina]|uniref:Phosphonoacetaldehyde methylase n=1 Tax=Roseospira marina TaxID=140057 RepID=A0A5M6IAM3_9PROT|nr:photosynthetic complex assembly protein PuhC [Roseospira marina]KAA5604977.1 hypothetical protein F1188_13125 [Roseospira marina]MBB4315019.1 putative photosynthetic complex assembly protein [Roseospira marina]MBB5088019.1 putative photosynthetic complex assembly protein [Roseospira marina]
MTDRDPHDLSPPKPLLYAIFAMVLVTIGLVGAVRILGLGPGQGEPATPPVYADVRLIEVSPIQEGPGPRHVETAASGEGTTTDDGTAQRGAEPGAGTPKEGEEAWNRSLEGAGTVTVERVSDGAVLTVLSEEHSGFIRGMMRSLGRLREVAEVPKDAPYRISQWHDGSLTFDDPATGESIAVRAFGADNRDQVAELLRLAQETPDAGAAREE